MEKLEAQREIMLDPLQHTHMLDLPVPSNSGDLVMVLYPDRDLLLSGWRALFSPLWSRVTV